MSAVSGAERPAFFEAVEEASKKAIWCALATVANNEARVRMVHPTWEGDVLWIATGPSTAKAREIQENSSVDIQFQVAPDDFVHLLVRGTASIHTDQATKDWFYPACAAVNIPTPGKLQDAFAQMMDTERRLVIEVVPEKWITFDATKMMMASIPAWKKLGLID